MSNVSSLPHYPGPTLDKTSPEGIAALEEVLAAMTGPTMTADVKVRMLRVIGHNDDRMVCREDDYFGLAGQYVERILLARYYPHTPWSDAELRALCFGAPA